MSKKQKKVVVPIRGCRSDVSDMNPDTDEIVGITIPPLTQTIAHARNLQLEFCKTAEEVLNWYGLQMPDVHLFVQSLNDQLQKRRLADSLCRGHVDGIMRPLHSILEKLVELHGHVAKQDNETVRHMQVRQAIAESDNYFAKMLNAFIDIVYGTLSLNTNDKRSRESARMTLEKIHQSAVKALLHISIITEQELALDDLIRATNRQLREEDSQLSTKNQLEDRRQDLIKRLHELNYRRQLYNDEKKTHQAQHQNFWLEHDSLMMFEGEWTRQKSLIETAAKLFTTAQLDPFQLVGIEQSEILSMPDQLDRLAIINAVPDNFPELADSTVGNRHATLLRDIEAAILELNKQENTSAKAMSPVAALPTAIIGPQASKPVVATVKVSPLHVVVAAFYAIREAAKLETVLGLLERHNLMFGNSSDELKTAFKDACKRRLIETGTKNTFLTSRNGESVAQTLGWYLKFPDHFWTALQQTKINQEA